jgi:FHA domain
MGALCESSSGMVFALEAHHLIGRSPRCSLRLDATSVSGEHASVRWTGTAWAIKDLGSRYGTFLNAQALKPGVPAVLQPSARLTFGREKHTWVMTSAAPPELMVVPASGGPALTQHDGMIAIPSCESPAASVFQDKDGRWILDHGGRAVALQEQVPFVVDGIPWRLCNASPVQPTSMGDDAREVMGLDEVQLCFRISRNEEHVRIAVKWRDRVVVLDDRSHHYVLLNLARVRLRDSNTGDQTGNAGWIDQEELLRLLQVSPEHLNLDVFRARRQFGEAGFIPGAGIVERRSTTKELRIGVSRVSIDVV